MIPFLTLVQTCVPFGSSFLDHVFPYLSGPEIAPRSLARSSRSLRFSGVSGRWPSSSVKICLSCAFCVGSRFRGGGGGFVSFGSLGSPGSDELSDSFTSSDCSLSLGLSSDGGFAVAMPPRSPARRKAPSGKVASAACCCAKLDRANDFRFSASHEVARDLDRWQMTDATFGRFHIFSKRDSISAALPRQSRVSCRPLSG